MHFPKKRSPSGAAPRRRGTPPPAEAGDVGHLPCPAAYFAAGAPAGAGVTGVGLASAGATAGCSPEAGVTSTPDSLTLTCGVPTALRLALAFLPSVPRFSRVSCRLAAARIAVWVSRGAGFFADIP